MVFDSHDNLESAFKTFTLSGEVDLPVVEGRKSILMCGVTLKHEVVLAFHRACGEEWGGE